MHVSRLQLWYRSIRLAVRRAQYQCRLCNAGLSAGHDAHKHCSAYICIVRHIGIEHCCNRDLVLCLALLLSCRPASCHAHCFGIMAGDLFTSVSE
jgi:hypothetical protein